MNDREDMYWAPRVNLHEIKLFYLKCTGKICDEKRLDNTGIALYLRCESILEYTWAHEGRVKCKRCYRNGKEIFIERITKTPRELIRCPVCGWQIQWRVYVSETEKKQTGQLMAGRARHAFEEYYRKYPECKESVEKIIAIDQLIHSFHWTLKSDLEKPTGLRTACVNLLEGNTTEINETLDNLTYGEETNLHMLETREKWSSQKTVEKNKKTDSTDNN